MYHRKEKKERTLGVHLHLKASRCLSPKCVTVRRPYRPGVHGKARRRAMSDFGRQLQEKQKFKLVYGVNEKGLKTLFQTASRFAGNVSGKLVELLERRLDNVVYRAGLAPSRGVARQFIVHGHMTVNGKRVRSPGFQVGVGDMIGIYEPSRSKRAFGSLQETLKNYQTPAWLKVDPDKLQANMVQGPEGVDVPFEVSLLVESFSK